MNTTAVNIYTAYFEEKNTEYIVGYKKWKKERPAKHEQTKAVRKAKAIAFKGEVI